MAWTSLHLNEMYELLFFLEEGASLKTKVLLHKGNTWSTAKLRELLLLVLVGQSIIFIFFHFYWHIIVLYNGGIHCCIFVHAQSITI